MRMWPPTTRYMGARRAAWREVCIAARQPAGHQPAPAQARSLVTGMPSRLPPSSALPPGRPPSSIPPPTTATGCWATCCTTCACPTRCALRLAGWTLLSLAAAAGRPPLLAPSPALGWLPDRAAAAHPCPAGGPNSGPRGRHRQLLAGPGRGGGLRGARAVRRPVSGDVGKGAQACWASLAPRPGQMRPPVAHATPIDLRSCPTCRRRWGGTGWSPCCWMQWRFQRYRQLRCGTRMPCSKRLCTTSRSRWVFGYLGRKARVQARVERAQSRSWGCAAALAQPGARPRPPLIGVASVGFLPAAAGRASAVCGPVCAAGAWRLRCDHHAAAGR